MGILAHRSTLAVGADNVLAVAPGAQDAREVVEVAQRRARAGHLAAEAGAGLDIVALVGDVSRVAEEEGGADLASRSGGGSQPRISEDISNNVGTFAVTTQNNFGARAFLAVCLHLGDSRNATLLNRGRVARGVGCIEQDIFIVAAGEAIASGVNDKLLSAWVALVPSAGEEDVQVGA